MSICDTRDKEADDIQPVSPSFVKIKISFPLILMTIDKSPADTRFFGSE